MEKYYAHRNINHQVTSTEYVSYNRGDVVDPEKLDEASFKYFLAEGYISTEEPDEVVKYAPIRTGGIDFDLYVSMGDGNEVTQTIATIKEKEDNLEIVENIKEVEKPEETEEEPEEAEETEEEEPDSEDAEKPAKKTTTRRGRR